MCSAVQHYYYPAIRPAYDPYSPKFTALADPPPNPYSWIVIRHVCRAWRIVALVFPEMSTRVVLTRPACVQDLLGRAGNLPLYIYQSAHVFTESHRDDMITSCNLVLPYLQRISRASLIFVDDTSYRSCRCQKAQCPELCRSNSTSGRLVTLGALFPQSIHFQSCSTCPVVPPTLLRFLTCSCLTSAL